jgi:HEAT repeat protein
MRRSRTLRRVLPAAVLALAAGIAHAQEGIDPVVRRLDEVSGDDWAAAVKTLEDHAERDRIVVATCRADWFPEGLGPKSLGVLTRLVSEHELRMANKGLRRLVRGPDTDRATRSAAAEALGRIGGLADVGALGDAMAHTPDAAARALVGIGGRAALAALRRGAGDPPGADACAAMVLLGDDSHLPELVARLRSADGPEAERLGGLLSWATGRELPAKVEVWEAHLRRRALAQRLGDIDNEAATAEVERLVAAIGDGSAPATLTDDLRGILLDGHFHVFARDKAALILGLANVKQAKDDLLAVMANGQPGSVRLYASEALARVGDLSCAMPLVDLLVHDEDRDRIKARRGQSGEYFPVDTGMARALYRLGLKGALGPLIGTLGKAFRTRMHRDCLRALRELSDGEEFGYHADSSESERVAAADRIRKWWFEHRDGIDIAPRADDPGWPEFRKAVAEKIEKLGTFKFLYQLRAKMALVVVADAVRPELEAALGHEGLHVRMGAAEVIRDAGLRAAAPALAERLAVEENPAAVTKLLSALRVCTRPNPDGSRAWDEEAAERIREHIRARMNDRQLEIRIAAAHALGVVGEESDVVRLKQARADARNAAETFRVASAGALLRLGDASGLDDVLGDLRSEDVALRADALALIEAAGCTESGFDPDAGAEDREAAVGRIRAHFGVSPGERR